MRGLAVQNPVVLDLVVPDVVARHRLGPVQALETLQLERAWTTAVQQAQRNHPLPEWNRARFPVAEVPDLQLVQAACQERHRQSRLKR